MHQEKTVDLHLHSTFSDGLFTPAQLVDMAKGKGLSAIALADHDIVDGFADLSVAAEAKGLLTLSGVELSCEHNGRDLHVLGYGLAVDHPGLQKMLGEFRSTRERRGIRIVEKLARQGIELDIDSILARAGGALGRPHIAEALVAGGYAADFAEVFAKYIGEDCPAYVEKYKIRPADAVDHIHDAGGLAFVAHPGYYLEDMGPFENLLAQGFDGIEVYHPQHRAAVIERLLGIARGRGLLVSGGSDFHGFAGRDNMGEPRVPFQLFEKIRARLG